jgi:hypothetical protein
MARSPLCSSGQSFWLQNGDVLCFLLGTNWIYICYVEESPKRRQKGNTVSDETVKYSYWALMTWLVSDYSVKYRPVFSSERTHWKQNNVIVKRKKKSKIKSGHGSQREARYPDLLVDWLSAARRTPTPRPPLCSSGQSSWLQSGDVLCFLWGTNWIYICYVEESTPIFSPVSDECRKSDQ